VFIEVRFNTIFFLTEMVLLAYHKQLFSFIYPRYFILVFLCLKALYRNNLYEIDSLNRHV
jgi:hypothetical protein